MYLDYSPLMFSLQEVLGLEKMCWLLLRRRLLRETHHRVDSQQAKNEKNKETVWCHVHGDLKHKNLVSKESTYQSKKLMYYTMIITITLWGIVVPFTGKSGEFNG